MTIELVKLPIYKEYHQFFSFNIAQQIFFFLIYFRQCC